MISGISIGDDVAGNQGGACRRGGGSSAGAGLANADVCITARDCYVTFAITELGTAFLARIGMCVTMR